MASRRRRARNLPQIAELRREVAALRLRLDATDEELDRTRKALLEALAETRRRTSRPPPPKI